MALKKGDRIKETTSTNGTGSITLLGAVSGFQTFASKCVNGDTIWYVIEHQINPEWEVGLGTWTTGGVLQRTIIYDSSNAGAAVDFSAGTKFVYNTLPADSLTLPAGSGSELQYRKDEDTLNGLSGSSVIAVGPQLRFTGNTYSISFRDGSGNEEILLTNNGGFANGGEIRLFSSFGTILLNSGGDSSFSGALAAASFNGVPLTISGLATEYLDGTGSYSTPPTTSPAGSGTELQYRLDATTFGAITGSSFNGSNVTIAHELWLVKPSTNRLIFGNNTSGAYSSFIFDGTLYIDGSTSGGDVLFGFHYGGKVGVGKVPTARFDVVSSSVTQPTASLNGFTSQNVSILRINQGATPGANNNFITCTSNGGSEGDIFKIDNIGNIQTKGYLSITSLGGFAFTSDGNIRVGLDYSGKGLQVTQGKLIGFAPVDSLDGTGSDTAIGRTSAGVMEVNDGTLGSLSELRLEIITIVSGYSLYKALSSTSTEREQAKFISEWLESTDATRKGRILFQVYDTAVRESARSWADGSNGRLATSTPNSAPTDSHLANSQISCYLDESANELKIRVKYSDGTLKTGTIALT